MLAVISLIGHQVCYIPSYRQVTAFTIWLLGERGNLRVGPLLISDLPAAWFCNSILYQLDLVKMGASLSNIDGLHNLNEAVQQAFEYSQFLIFVVHGSALALLQHGNWIYLFDSHFRNKNGLQCPDGKCCIVRFRSYVTLTSFLRSLTKSLCSQDLSTVQFDLNCVKVNEVPTNVDLQTTIAVEWEVPNSTSTHPTFSNVNCDFKEENGHHKHRNEYNYIHF